MKSFVGKIVMIIVGVIIVLQLIPVERTNPAVDADKDLLNVTNPDKEVADLIKAACYDCHSHETVWPWYSYVAPASWLVSNHVVEARDELNFSEWTDYNAKKMDHKLEECEEALTEGWMPDESYVKMHEEAKLTDKQRQLLTSFFKELRASI